MLLWSRMEWILRTFFVLIACALASCHSPRPIPGSASVAGWQKKFAALDCWNPRHFYDMASTEPVLFAMARICHRRLTVVAIDARTDEVRAVPFTAITVGGVHYTASGDVVWYSSSLSDEFKSPNHASAFTLRKGELKEQRIGRLEVPFEIGAGIGFIKGEGCHLVSFHNRLVDEKTPRLSQYFIVKDEQPFSSSKALDGVGRGLFWDPVRRHFVVQKQPPSNVGYRARQPLDRYAIDCSGATVAMDAEVIRRLEPIRDESATYVMSHKGDLLVAARKEHSEEDVITVFNGDKTSHINPPEHYTPCPDLGCDPFYEHIFPEAWSPSGEHFMVTVGFKRVDIYRAADMQIVKQWKMKGSRDFPVYGFINDHVAYGFGEHSRLTFQEW